MRAQGQAGAGGPGRNSLPVKGHTGGGGGLPVGPKKALLDAGLRHSRSSLPSSCPSPYGRSNPRTPHRGISSVTSPTGGQGDGHFLLCNALSSAMLAPMGGLPRIRQGCPGQGPASSRTSPKASSLGKKSTARRPLWRNGESLLSPGQPGLPRKRLKYRQEQPPWLYTSNPPEP
jgi:hypothetical protein